MKIIFNIKNHMCICTDTYVTIVNSNEVPDEEIPKFVKMLRCMINREPKLQGKYKRTEESWIKEWVAHNRLYRKGLFVDHTRDVDLDENESKIRLIAYFFIGNLKRSTK